MKQKLIILVTLLMVSLNSFANGIIGVWEQNSRLHNYTGDNLTLVFWQFTENGQFHYTETNCGQVYNALRGRYSLSGSSLELVIEDVIYHHSQDAASFNVGMTATINVSASDNEMTFSNNPFAEVATLTLNRISSYPMFSPEEVVQGTWSNNYMDCSGNLDSDENNATRLNSDHTLFYVWEYNRDHVAAKGSWSISSDNKLCWTYEESDNPAVEWIGIGITMSYPILICCPERITLLQNDHHEGNDMPVFIPSDGSLIDKYFGGVDAVDADPSPRITTTGDSLQIENADNAAVTVFDIDGKTLVSQQSYDGKPIPLSAGQYIVKVNGSVFKTIVR